jgi:hypothetical protein
MTLKTSKTAIKVSDTQTVKTTDQIYDSGTYLTKNWIEKAPAGVNTFAIQNATKSTSIKLNGTGDTVFIQGNYNKYQCKQNGKVITLDDRSHSKIVITLNDLSTKIGGEVAIELVFLDGSVTIGNALGSTKLKVDGFIDRQNTAEASMLLTSKYQWSNIYSDTNYTSNYYFSDHSHIASNLIPNDKDLSSTASVQIDLVGITPDTSIN